MHDVQTPRDTHTIWQSVLVDIELDVSSATFNTWFKDSSIAHIEDGVVSIAVPNEFVKTWLAEKYTKTLLRLLREKIQGVRVIQFVIGSPDSFKPTPIHTKQVTGVSIPGGVNPARLPIAEHYVNKDDNLNPRYTFDTFITGAFNQLAHAAAQAVVRAPGTTYNPFFIYGDTGRGKTHLMQALGNAIKSAHVGKKIFYVSAEQFAVDYIDAVKRGQANQFKHKYRGYDMIIMDDVQFLQKTDKTQEELFHLFNTMHDSNGQIVFSSDTHPSFLQNMDSRLLSRFSAGMVVEIAPPDHESRSAIIQTKAARLGLPLSTAVLSFLAEYVFGSIREIEGALNALDCQYQMSGKEPTLIEAKHLIKETMRPKRTMAPSDVIKTVAQFYSIDESSIYEKTRRKEIVRPRQIIMFLLREDFNISYPTIGHELGGRDHTTVMHSCEKLREEMKTSIILSQEITQLRTLLK